MFALPTKSQYNDLWNFIRFADFQGEHGLFDGKTFDALGRVMNSCSWFMGAIYFIQVGKSATVIPFGRDEIHEKNHLLSNKKQLMENV